MRQKETHREAKGNSLFSKTSTQTWQGGEGTQHHDQRIRRNEIRRNEIRRNMWYHPRPSVIGRKRSQWQAKSITSQSVKPPLIWQSREPPDQPITRSCLPHPYNCRCRAVHPSKSGFPGDRMQSKVPGTPGYSSPLEVKGVGMWLRWLRGYGTSKYYQRKKKKRGGGGQYWQSSIALTFC